MDEATYRAGEGYAMIGQLTLGERRLALFVLIGLAAIGLFITAVGRDDVISGHGALIILAALVGTFAVISGYYLPEPPDQRL